jgi:hypothetical protein
MDVTMLIYFGSPERTISEWKELLSKADPRYKLQAVHADPKKPNTLLEIGWKSSQS